MRGQFLRLMPATQRLVTLAVNPIPVECRCLAASPQGILGTDTYDCGYMFTKDLATGKVKSTTARSGWTTIAATSARLHLPADGRVFPRQPQPEHAGALGDGRSDEPPLATRRVRRPIGELLGRNGLGYDGRQPRDSVHAGLSAHADLAAHLAGQAGQAFLLQTRREQRRVHSRVAAVWLHS